MKILAIGDFHGKFPDKLKRRIKKENPDLIVGLGDYTGIDEWRKYWDYAFKLSSQKKAWPTAEEFFGKKRLRRIIKKDEKVAKKVLLALLKFGKPIISVFGNGDDEWYNYPFEISSLKADGKKLKFIRNLKKSGRFRDITYGKTFFSGINFAGFGGYMDVTSNYRKGKSLMNALRRIRKSRAMFFKILGRGKKYDIFLMHYPPRGAFDIIKNKKSAYHGKSAGIAMFREAIKKYNPKLVLCGHMHEYQGAKKMRKSLIVNPGDAERGRCAIIDYPSLKVTFIK